jgi:hypothetical protein
LNKSVVIEGNYIQQQPQSVSAPASRPMVGGAVQTQSPQAGARIVGRAQINGRTEVEIDAVSVPPR